MGLIYLIRHGETEGNVKQIFRGKWDVPLNERGRSEAETLAARLDRDGIERVFASPLSRARETAAPLAARLALAIEPDPGFDDIDVGQWQGMEVGEAERKHPNLYQIWTNSPDIFKFPHGESLEDLRGRAYARLLEVAREHRNRTIAIITHQVVNRVLILSALGLSLKNYWRIHQTTGAINVLEWTNDEFRFHGINLNWLDSLG